MFRILPLFFCTGDAAYGTLNILPDKGAMFYSSVAMTQTVSFLHCPLSVSFTVLLFLLHLQLCLLQYQQKSANGLGQVAFRRCPVRISAGDISFPNRNFVHYATNRQVAGSIPDGVIDIFQWHNPSGRTMALGSTQPLTEMSTRCISWG